MKYYKLVEPIASKKTYGTLPNFVSNWEEIYGENFINSKALFIGKDKNILVPKLFQRDKKSAKITNILSAETAGYMDTLIIDIKTKNVLEEYNLHKVVFFETDFKMLNGETLKYYFVKFKEGGYEFLDYENTIFNEFEKLGQEIKFNSNKELGDFEKNIPISIKHLELKPNIKIDFFGLKKLDRESVLGIYISERLKERLEKEKFTGFQIIGINEDKWKLKAAKK